MVFRRILRNNSVLSSVLRAEMKYVRADMYDNNTNRHNYTKMYYTNLYNHTKGIIFALEIVKANTS